jgi:hypothetical protein
VVGAKKWKIIEKRVANVSNLVSASDIAFGWITLENAISRWEWEYGKDKKVIKEMEEHKDPSVIQPIYTTWRGKNSGKDKGWSAEGLARYNTLLSLAKQGRIDDGSRSFDAYFKTYIERMNGLDTGAANVKDDRVAVPFEADLDF